MYPISAATLLSSTKSVAREGGGREVSATATATAPAATAATTTTTTDQHQSVSQQLCGATALHALHLQPILHPVKLLTNSRFAINWNEIGIGIGTGLWHRSGNRGGCRALRSRRHWGALAIPTVARWRSY